MQDYTKLHNYKKDKESFLRYVEDRLNAYCNKYSGTNYKVPEYFNVVRIENIFREMDKSTIYLEDKCPIEIEKVFLFTVINNLNTWDKFISFDYDKNLLIDYIQNNRQVLTNAYNPLTAFKIMMNPDKLKNILEIVGQLDLSVPNLELSKQLKEIPHIGNFLSHQLILNFRLLEMTRIDKEFFILGNGSNRGIEYIFGDKSNLQMKINALYEQINKRLFVREDGKFLDWTFETIENCLCGFSKAFNVCQRVYKNTNENTKNYVITENFIYKEIF